MLHNQTINKNTLRFCEGQQGVQWQKRYAKGTVWTANKQCFLNYIELPMKISVPIPKQWSLPKTRDAN